MVGIIFFLIIIFFGAWGLSAVKITAGESAHDKWKMIESKMSLQEKYMNALRFVVYGPFSKKLIKKLYDENEMQ